MLLEALEQLLSERFQSSRGDDELFTSLYDEIRDTMGHLFRSPGIESLLQATNNDDLMKLVDPYQEFRMQAGTGSIGRTAQL